MQKPISSSYKLATVDLGTNSIRFDIYLIEKGQPPRRIYRKKEMVRLGEEVFRTGFLCEKASQRTLAQLEEFASLCRLLEVNQSIAFATSALRTAKDSARFVEQAKKSTGFEIKVISGKRESELIAKAILARDNIPHDCVFIDIGGGSTEMTHVQNGKIKIQDSFPLGAIRLEQMFFENYDNKKERINGVLQMQAYVRKLIQEDKNFSQLRVHVAIGSSGTIRSYRKIIKKQFNEAQPFRKKSLDKVLEQIIALNKTELAQYPGVEEKRIDILLSGGILLAELLEYFDCRKIYTTSNGMRDGILIDALESF